MMPLFWEKPMLVDTLTLGQFETNCYILRSGSASTDCAIIDAGLDEAVLLDFLSDRRLNPSALLLTHGHIDHIAAVEALRNRYPRIKVCIHRLDAELLSDSDGNLSFMTGHAFTARPAEVHLEEADIIDEAGIEFKVLHTPGHTPGGISLYAKDDGVVFVGDTLFADSVGRTDFVNGSMSQLVKSIRQKLFTLPDETVVYPGHGPQTTIAREKKYNPFLQ